ncbi:fimbrial protein [Salmonella enterica]|nr:fimbrial protein [Salmonella enterica]EAX5088136.1 fimbrial protein [Salmonella enterica]EBQ4932030.1 fimbrial protein [Salmonella enterica]
MMKKTLMAVALFSALPVLAADYSEKTQYLGVVNGQVVGNSVVKVTRTPADPVLYRTESNGPLPETLVIRNAESRPASGNMAYITVKRTLGDGRDARLTLKTTLMVDGQRAAITAGQRGEDVVITVPAATRQVELRSDAPAELEVPANYRGNVQVPVEVEGISAG